jgi:hypothetical protein
LPSVTFSTLRHLHPARLCPAPAARTRGAFTCVSGAEAAVVAGVGRGSRLGDDPPRPARPAPYEIGQPAPCGPERCPPSLGTVERASDTRPLYSPQGPTPQCNNFQRRQRRFGSADGGDSGECSARAGSLERSDAPSGRRTAGCLSIRVEPRATRLEITRSR